MIGILYALLSAGLFGLSTPLAKLLLGDVSPWLLAGLLYLGSGLGLALVRLVRRSNEAGLSRRDVPWFGAAVLSGGVVGPVLLVFGLAQSSASEAALLLNLESVMTLAIAWIVFKENVDRRLLIGAAAIVAGAAVLAWPRDAAVGLSWGPVLIAGACLAWAIDNNLTRKVAAADPMQIAMVKGLVAGIANVAIALALGAPLPGAAAAAGAGVLGFFSYGVSLTLFVLALRHLGTARTGAYYALAPFIGAGVAILLLGEPIGVAFVAGGFLMAVGLWLHLSEQHLHEHVHDPLEHEHVHVHDAHHRHAHAPGTPPEPHVHAHRHARLIHRHPHYPDLHHRHSH
ncbi:DMT family transporter [Dongia sedimenti]|uniref:DMT family transporter n=1 Tax=Dongia sedimenti TaxID=3064282 RepID=A0ABU0YG41_9PROT|nr:DMT family transporter [Rhodospirillaceae bacterium R-7]